MSTKGSAYHIALDGNGYIIKDTPLHPKRSMIKAPVFGNRFAFGDRSYSDFSLWWYWAQTDWSGGIKDQKEWADDAKYFYSTNIDTWSEIGAIKLTPALTLAGDISETIICGAYCTRNSVSKLTIGTSDNASNKPVVYEYTSSTWTDVSSASFGTNQNAIAQISSRKNYTWISTIGIGMTNVISYWDGTTMYDASSHAHSVLSSQMPSSSCHIEIGGTLYVFMNDYLNNNWACVSCTKANPTSGADWTKVLEYNEYGWPISACEYNGDLYYLVSTSTYVDLRCYDIANSIDIKIHRFYGQSMPNWGVGDKYLHNYNGNLVITIPNNEIWEMDSTQSLTRIYKVNSYKDSLTNDSEASSYLYYGAIASDDKLWWGNLMYDGENFYNTFKNTGDTTTHYINMLFNGPSNVMYLKDTSDDTKIYTYNTNDTTFRSGSDKNFLIMSQMAEVTAIDKLANSVVILFDKFASGQEIKIKYSIDDMATWTDLGTASYTLDGGSVTQKTFLFGANLSFSKMFFKIYLNSSGTTPVLRDLALQYIPIPDYKFQWVFKIDASDDITLLDKRTKNPLNGWDVRHNLRASFLKQSIIELEDIDYRDVYLNGSLSASNTTITVDSTDGFPEQGRLKIENEEILYTSKSATTFKGCTRGYRGTAAVAHSDNVLVSTKYKVLITDYQEAVSALNDETAENYIISITLIES